LNKKKSFKDDFAFKFLFFILVIFIGFRHQVGADWFNYLSHVENQFNIDLSLNYERRGFLYLLIVWFASNIFGGIYFVNLILALIFCYGLYRFAEYLDSNRYSLLMIAFPVLIVIIGLGFSRQSAAVGLFMLALVELLKGNNIKYILLVLMAALFHLSAIILIPIVFLFVVQKKYILYPIIIIVIYFTFNFLFLPNIDYYNDSYIKREYNSSGALIRILLIMLPALIFLKFKIHMVTNVKSLKIWRFFSYAILTSFLLLLLSPSSTSVDRLSFYLIPLQLFVFSNLDRLPTKFNGHKLGDTFVFLFGLIVLSAWILFSDHSKYWMPYDSYLFNI
jgi:hypothetical protein